MTMNTGCVNRIVFLSGSGFPDNKSAYVNKLTLMSKALLESGYHTVILSKSASKNQSVKRHGFHEGIEYLYLSGNKSKIGRVTQFLSYLRAHYRELVYLIRLSKRSVKCALIMSYTPALMVIYYWIVARILKHKLIISIMEYHLSTASGFTKKVNAYFFDHLSYGFCDGVIPISHYLEDVVRKRFTHKPTLILPVLADYHISVDTADSLTLISELGAQKYFLYCAGIGYRDTCEFVTRSFIELGNPDVKLVMVLSGHPRSIAEFRNQYEKYGNIVVLSDLTYSQLYSCYQNALALLVPLREQRKDEARFPQKIAEYLSSARPIITNGFGEINFHFRDKDNAFVVDNYNESMFCEAMNFVLNNPKIAEGIGLRGREYGLSHFHYQVHSTRLMSFIESL